MSHNYRQRSHSSLSDREFKGLKQTAGLRWVKAGCFGCVYKELSATQNWSAWVLVSLGFALYQGGHQAEYWDGNLKQGFEFGVVLYGAGGWPQ